LLHKIHKTKIKSKKKRESFMTFQLYFYGVVFIIGLTKV